MVRSVRIDIDAEKCYVLLCLKKWYEYVTSQESIPNLSFDFYVSDSTKVGKSGVKKASLLYCVIDDALLNEHSINVYIDRLRMYLETTFIKVWVSKEFLLSYDS